MSESHEAAAKAVRGVGKQLTRLGSGDLDTETLAMELAAAHQGLEAARSLVGDDDTAGIIDQQRASHWWQRKLMSTLPMAVLETDHVGRIAWANQAAATLLGRDVLKVVRTQLQSYAVDEAPVVALLERLREGNRPAEDRMIFSLRGPAKQTLSISLVPTPLADGAGDEVITWMLQALIPGDESDISAARTAAAFSALCLLPLRAESQNEALIEVARLCQDVSSPHSSVSVTIGPPSGPQHLASSTDFARDVDAAQLFAGEGPCQQAWDTGTIVLTDNAIEDERWPEFAKAASNTGMASALAAPIKVGDDLIGVLNVYSVEVGAFVAGRLTVIELLADAAGAVMHHMGEERLLRDLAADLECSMIKRAVIEQAKGILMSHYRCTADEAFTRLARASERRGTPLSTIAQSLVQGIHPPLAEA